MAKLEQTNANLFTRAAAGLPGVASGDIAIADVNEDDDPDVLLTGGGGTASLYLQNDQGGFTKFGAGLTGVSGSAASIADVDGDGDQDLLITGHEANGDPNTTLYLQDDDGNFSEAGDALVDVVFGSVSVADVDGDDESDLLITGRNANGDPITTLYFQNEDGTFSEASAGLQNVYQSSTSIADVDGDQGQDLLITGYDANRNPTATLYLQGDDGFTEANVGLTGVGWGSSSSVADVDGDGLSDILVAGWTENNLQSTTLYLQADDGSFAEAGAGLTGVDHGSTSIADVDGDGKKDLLITGYWDIPIAHLYLQADDGDFREAGAGLSGVEYSTSSIADVDGDGDEDLLIAGIGDYFGTSTRLYVNRTQQASPNRSPRFSRSTFNSNSRLTAGMAMTRVVETGDPDGDRISIHQPQQTHNVSVTDAGNGMAEVTFSPDRSQVGETVDIQLEASDSDRATASFSTSVQVPSVVTTGSARFIDVSGGSTSIADVDGDERLDLLVTGANEGEFWDGTATLYLQNEDGSFSEAGAELTEVRYSTTSIADVDGDGNKDLLIAGQDEENAHGTTLYLQQDDGSFSEAGAGLPGLFRGDTSIADVDGNGLVDVLIVGRDGNENHITTLHLQQEDGSFTKAEAGLDEVWTGVSTSIADVDGDGHQDLLIAGYDRLSTPNTALYLGEVDGTFDTVDVGLTDVVNASASIADVDGNGTKDLLISGDDAEGNPTTTLYLQSESGSFESAEAGLKGASGSNTPFTSIADVNGDGRQDLLLAGDNHTTLYLQKGDGSFTEAQAGLVATSNGTVSTGDLDSDGDSDFVITGRSSLSEELGTVLYENHFDNPLPVELSDFHASVDDGTVQLAWTTVSETNNTGFRVQRRVVGGVQERAAEKEQEQEGAWTTVGSVDGAGTTSEPQSYQFADANMPYVADRLTYRLKQVDTDGSAHYSEAITVERSVDEVELSGTYPNPAQQQVTLRYALPEKQEVTLRLYDVLGRRVQTIVETRNEGRHERTVDVRGLSSGVYFLRLQAKGEIRTQKLTVVR